MTYHLAKLGIFGFLLYSFMSSHGYIKSAAPAIDPIEVPHATAQAAPQAPSIAGLSNLFPPLQKAIIEHVAAAVSSGMTEADVPRSKVPFMPQVQAPAQFQAAPEPVIAAVQSCAGHQVSLTRIIGAGRVEHHFRSDTAEECLL